MINSVQTNFEIFKNNNLQQNTNKEFKREFLQTFYDKKYEQAKKEHKYGSFVLPGLAILAAIAAYKAEPSYKTEATISLVAFAIASVVFPFFKPKKEKYDKLIEQKLNEVV